MRPIPELAERLGRYLCDKFKAFFAESQFLAAAINEISDAYLGGEDLLFVDTRAELDTETSNLRKTADTFGPLVAWLNVEPITVEGFTTGHPMVDAKAAELADYSHAHALARGGTLGEFLSALQKVSPDMVTR